MHSINRYEKHPFYWFVFKKSKVKKSDDLHKLDKKSRKKKNKTKELKNFYAHQMKAEIA